MSAQQLYDAVVKELLIAYFDRYSMTALSKAFDRIIRELNVRQLLVQYKKFDDFGNELVKMLLSFLMSALVERGFLDQPQRYTSQFSTILGGLCNVDNFREYCERLGNPDEFSAWTHTTLYVIGALRNGRMITTYDGSVNADFRIDTDTLGPSFLSNVILLFYGFLIQRLVTCAMILRDERDRLELEGCAFLVFLSFYYDYVYYTKNLWVTAEVLWWNMFLKQIRATYLQKGRFFTVLKLRYDFDAYFHEDNIVTFYSCVVSNFIDLPRNKILLTTKNIGVSERRADVVPAMTCLSKTNLNSLSMKYNAWFRYFVYSKFMRRRARDIRFIKETIEDIGGGVREAAILGHSIYQNLYNDKWPTVTGVAGVSIGLVAFSGSLWARFARNRLRWGYKQLAAAYVFAFHRQQIVPKYTGRIHFEKARKPAFLVWERTPDGRHSVIYTVIPMPTILLDEGAPIVFQGQTGGKRKNVDADIDRIASAFKRGRMINTLPIEAQLYLRRKMQLNTKMRGGSQYGGIFQGRQQQQQQQQQHVDYDDDEHGGRYIPEEAMSSIIDTADDVAFIREDPDDVSLQLTLPLTKWHKEALEEGTFVAVSDPALEKESPPRTENSLPPDIPETDLSEPPSVQHQVKPLQLENVPPPPIDPAVALPTITETKRQQLLEKTVAPEERRRDYVVVKRRTKTRGRRRRM